MKTAQPKVSLLESTGMALEMLIYTKSGRLGGDTTIYDILYWPESKKLEHLEYMFDTIQSAFEFVSYIFEIRNVSKSFTHQFVRTRPNSYQQETGRAVDVRDSGCKKSIDDPIYEVAVDNSLSAYAELIDKGYAIQDAREILPSGMHTRIFVKANLRTLSQTAELRLCTRTQGEYQDVFKMMIKEILKIHPYFELLLKPYCVKTGLCYFPRYKKCPIQKYTVNPIADQAKATIERAWKTTPHKGNPVAKDERTM